MSVAGIDFSSRFVDVVLLDEDTDAATWHRFELEGADAFDRARDVRKAMPGGLFWDMHGVLAVGIEEPMMRGGGMSSAYSLYRVQGAILSKLPAMTLVHPIKPSSWRKTVGLLGNCQKWEVEQYVHASTTTYTADWPQDACDAYCIALATRTLIQRVAA